MADKETNLIIRATDRTQAAFSSATAGLESMNAKALSLQKAFIAVAGAGAIGALITRALDAASALKDASQAAGLTVENYQRLRFAASQSGIEQEQFAKATQKFAGVMGEARDQTSGAADTFRQLGINVLNTNGQLRGGDAVLNQVLSRLSSFTSQAERANYASKLFGERVGPKLAAAVAESGDNFAALYQKAQDLGLVMSTDVANGAESARDKFEALSQQISMRFTKAVADNAEAIGHAADVLSDFFTKGVRGFENLVRASEKFDEWVYGLIGMGSETTKTSEEIDMLTARLHNLNNALKETWRSPIQLEQTRKEADETAAKLEMLIDKRDKLYTEKGYIGEAAKAPKAAPKIADNMAAVSEDPRIAKQNADLIKQTKSIEDALKTQEERIQTSYDARQFIIEESFQKGLTGYAEYDATLTRLQEDRDARMVELALNSPEAQRQIRAAEQLAQLQAQYLSEDELTTQTYLDRQFVLEDAFQQQLLTYQEYAALTEQTELEHQAALGNITAQGLLARQKFEKLTLVQQTQTVLGTLANITAGVAQNNKTMFEINKVAGTANAIINTYEGVTKALSSYPPPINIAMAAVTAAAGFAQVSAIQSTSFGGGGGAPSLAGSTPATPVSPVGGAGGLPDFSGGQTDKAGQAHSLTVDLGANNGRMLTVEQARQLYREIEDQRREIGDNTTLLFV